ncbi:endolytic transglycosylase MltG [Campylobacter insulaenigrae]|uniref:endolytic transglycosylase MltG n=1 Tax=Campylobacter insulaenigrae TaxID=260714 RepID=UPI000F6FB589|nr:endolytic transglycosylase MltG [Campylobacter insulaenigrae]MCR6571292.1 endolytic transglycosylase MltG [Campylobacter insulaenigrae]MCR6571826.1 endolytic transglycosylase MltG [Campylobacter insulaenigrae]MCR6574566.1 endolytic transglycosylase MltG [Campylobacter insulaenigrae]MCR6576015.1 endolytic transglycosylase MltG [Campylobacter insulaenigrae]MCR6577531.1 endolytic transglycosylase MltG [Campylobacter insulaenigrae]
MNNIIGKVKNLRIFLISCDLILIFILSIFFYLLLPIKTNSVVFIPQGSVAKIITQLNKNNYKMSSIDKYILYFLGHPQSGWINIGLAPLNRVEFLHKLTIAKAALETITLIPGETTEVFFEQLAPKLDLDAKILMQEFQKQSPFKEGMLFPETYKFPKGITEELLIKYLLSYSTNEFKKISYKIFREYNENKWHNYIIIASIIQKEAANNQEMPIVSSVIRNRLKKDMKLQMDGTLNYGKYSHEKITPQRIRQDDTSYNTYKFNGIPKEAVCNVSIDAIKAAIFPAKSDYLYFVRDKKTNKHIFSTNLKDHNKAIKN